MRLDGDLRVRLGVYVDWMYKYKQVNDLENNYDRYDDSYSVFEHKLEANVENQCRESM